MCGSAMLPRSDRKREWYVCAQHADDKNACPMPKLNRAAVEKPALRMFKKWALDLEGTCAGITEQMDSRVTLARSQANRAATEAATARAMLDRIDRDYETGELGGAGYERQFNKQTEVLAAAEAEHARLTEHADEIAAERDTIDAQTEMLRRLAELQAGIAEQVSTAAERDVEALRVAISSVFAACFVVPEDQLYEALNMDAELHEPFDAPEVERVRRADGTEVLAVTNGVLPAEASLPRLALVPLVRDELLTDGQDGLSSSDPLRRIALSFPTANNVTATQVLLQMRTSSA